MKLMQIIKILINLSRANYVEHYFPKHKLSAAELIPMLLNSITSNLILKPRFPDIRDT